jgi:hypothetical protein
MAKIDQSKLSQNIKSKYRVENNTLFATPKDDWRDRIQTELFDTKDKDENTVIVCRVYQQG